LKCFRNARKNSINAIKTVIVLVTRCRGSILLWRRNDTLCTSGFIDDVIFAHKPRLFDVAANLKRSAHTALGLAINCAVITVAGRWTHTATFRALKETSQVAAPGVKSAVYGSPVLAIATSRRLYENSSSRYDAVGSSCRRNRRRRTELGWCTAIRCWPALSSVACFANNSIISRTMQHCRCPQGRSQGRILGTENTSTLFSTSSDNTKLVHHLWAVIGC